MDLKTVRTSMHILAGTVILLCFLAIFINSKLLIWSMFINLAAMIWISLAYWRCPHCRRHLGRDSWLGMFCPHCGKVVE